MSLVAVVVPTSDRPALSADEELALRHVRHYLGGHDCYLVAPEGMAIARDGFEVLHLPTRYFGSARAHSRLQLSPEFYERFTGYEFILMHHLDALVLSDALTTWCEAGLDFIGAPWLPCADSPWVTQPRVGNSGFALMRVERFLAVLRSTRPVVDPDADWAEFSAGRPRYQQWLHAPRKYLKRLPYFNSGAAEARRWARAGGDVPNCDYFWSDVAPRVLPDFRIATVEQGLAFAFEVAPTQCFELNHRRLPFGCHAWNRYDRAFWEPYLLS
jgi:hypothetical protein